MSNDGKCGQCASFINTGYSLVFIGSTVFCSSGCKRAYLSNITNDLDIEEKIGSFIDQRRAQIADTLINQGNGIQSYAGLEIDQDWLEGFIVKVFETRIKDRLESYEILKQIHEDNGSG